MSAIMSATGAKSGASSVFGPRRGSQNLSALARSSLSLVALHKHMHIFARVRIIYFKFAV